MPLKRPPAYGTLLDDFIIRHRLEPASVARGAGCSRQHLLRLRRGVAEPTREIMIRITEACRYLTGQRVAVSDLFELRFTGTLTEQIESINPS